jgi:hypothetical protein
LAGSPDSPRLTSDAAVASLGAELLSPLVVNMAAAEVRRTAAIAAIVRTLRR